MDPISVVGKIFSVAEKIYDVAQKVEKFPEQSESLRGRVERVVLIVKHLPRGDEHYYTKSLSKLLKELESINKFLTKLDKKNVILQAVKHAKILEKFAEFHEMLEILQEEIMLALGTESFKNRQKEFEELKQKLVELNEKLVKSLAGASSEDLPTIDSGHLTERISINKGRLANTYKATYKYETVAFKTYDVGQNKDLEKILRREAENLRQLNSEYIVRLFGICIDPDYVHIVFEYMARGSLRKVLDSVGGDLQELPLERRVQMALDGAIGLYRMHSMTPRPLVHQDIGSDVFLVHENWKVKVSGIGFARSEETIRKKSRPYDTKRTTLNYKPPERLKNINLKMTRKMDVYSFGMVLYEIATGDKPYEGMKDEEIGKFVTAGKKLPVPDLNLPEFNELIDACRNSDPLSRPVADEIVKKLKAIRASMEQDLLE